MAEATNEGYLMTRQQAADFLGIDPVSFDRYYRHDKDSKAFMIGKQARYTKESLIAFVREHEVTE